jgi:hypothetical protein
MRSLPITIRFPSLPKEDGVYWFNAVEVDIHGRKVPSDLTKAPPDLKVLVDTTPPLVRFTGKDRIGENVTITWEISDCYPNEAATRVHFRTIGSSNGAWREVSLRSLPIGTRNGVRFPAGTAGPIQVRVIAQDLVGNQSEVILEVPGESAQQAAAVPVTPASYSLPEISIAPSRIEKKPSIDSSPNQVKTETLQILIPHGFMENCGVAKDKKETMWILNERETRMLRASVDKERHHCSVSLQNGVNNRTQVTTKRLFDNSVSLKADVAYETSQPESLLDFDARIQQAVVSYNLVLHVEAKIAPGETLVSRMSVGDKELLILMTPEVLNTSPPTVTTSVQNEKSCKRVQ